MGADLQVRLMCESLHVTKEFVMRGGEQVGRDRERLVCALNAMIFFLRRSIIAHAPLPDTIPELFDYTLQTSSTSAYTTSLRLREHSRMALRKCSLC